MKKIEEKQSIPLSCLPIGMTAEIEKIEMPMSERVRLSDLGMSKSAEVVCLGTAPLGSPRAYLVRGRIIAVRGKDAGNIICKIQKVGI